MDKPNITPFPFGTLERFWLRLRVCPNPQMLDRWKADWLKIDWEKETSDPQDRLAVAARWALMKTGVLAA